MEASFRAVDSLIKSWNTGDYVHHLKHTKEKGEDDHEFLAIFSIPVPTKPVPERVALAKFYVSGAADGAAQISYEYESNQRRLPGRLPIRKQWLDAALRRKQIVTDCSVMFARQGKLPQPQPFVPGMYKASDAVLATAMGGLDDNEDRLIDGMAALGEAQDVEARNMEESVVELEQLLVQIFRDADVDGNGYLDPSEFSCAPAARRTARPARPRLFFSPPRALPASLRRATA